MAISPGRHTGVVVAVGFGFFSPTFALCADVPMFLHTYKLYAIFFGVFELIAQMLQLGL